MFGKIVNAILGDPQERVLKQYQGTVDAVNALEETMQALSDDQLAAKTAEFKQRLAEDETLDDLLPEVFAVVRETSRRTTGLRHYDVQLIGGTVLHEGRIAEMRTGEGKTLVATLPLYLNSLTGKGAHLVTPNDYLSKVGLQLMGPIYHFLGVSAAVIQSQGDNPRMSSFVYDPDYHSEDERYENLRPVSRREAYAADITYGTNNEFGFDYLRDNMVRDPARFSQRGHAYAIVDEVDNILIDEARTPLIISGTANQPSELYTYFAGVVKPLKNSSDESVEYEEPDGDYVYDIKDKTVYLTDQGIEKVERQLMREGRMEQDASLYSPENADMIPYLDNALRAKVSYEKDKDYVVMEGQVIIVDEFTGRLMHGRRFSEGLHQAIEAKEGVEVRRENVTMATITFQNFFRKYDKLAGMTGTAATESAEFEKIYDLEVVVIPTHKPIQRLDLQDLIFKTEKGKFEAIARDIKERYERGQPVLVGTVAIETSERLSKYLKKEGVPHEVLNAKQHFREASIIAQAGRPGAVTIATNMAGRGVDILLGGNPEGLARDTLRRQGQDLTEVDKATWQAALKDAEALCKADRQRVKEAGGLYVLGTERHEARRIDNQLRGRSGRQGDPGESRFYLSLEDDLMRRFGGDRVKGFMEMANMPEDEPIQHGMISKSIEQAQIRVEGHNFDIRKRVLEYDDVVNKQREAIYDQRREVLAAGENELRERIQRMIAEEVTDLVDIHLAGSPDDWDLQELYRQALALYPVPEDIQPENWEQMSDEEIENELLKGALRAYDAKIQEVGSGERMAYAERDITLQVIDRLWVRHLTDLSVLREGIGLQGIRGRDPLVEYKIEGFQMYQALQEEIQSELSRLIYRFRIEEPVQQTFQNIRASHASSTPSKPEPVRATEKDKVGRNDPCWCGSGKKYKHCHYKEDQLNRDTVDLDSVASSPSGGRRRRR
jgi:preprotein translocase subunit SecA